MSKLFFLKGNRKKKRERKKTTHNRNHTDQLMKRLVLCACVCVCSLLLYLHCAGRCATFTTRVTQKEASSQCSPVDSITRQTERGKQGVQRLDHVKDSELKECKGCVETAASTFFVKEGGQTTTETHTGTHRYTLSRYQW